jgi:hypothetical protein
MSTQKLSEKTRAKVRTRRQGETKPAPDSKELMGVLHPRSRFEPIQSKEFKHYAVSSGAYAGVAYSGVVTDLFAPAQGLATTQRVGDEARQRAIRLALNCYAQGTSTSLRVIVFAYNADSTLAVPTPNSILTTVATSAAMVSPYNDQAAEQGTLNVLCDKVLLCAAGGPSTAYMLFESTFLMPVTFSAAATSGVGKLYLLVVSDSILTTNSPLYQWYSRVYFDDY